MTQVKRHEIAIVGVGAVLPDAPNAAAFWQNVQDGRSSITEVTPDRWDPAYYYDPDPRAPDKSYSKLGGWVRDLEWDPLAWRLPIPPRVSAVMDATQRYAIVAARAALTDYGYPQRPLEGERTAVILGNAMGGDNHLLTGARILFPEIAHELAGATSFRQLPGAVQGAVLEELWTGVRGHIPDITEDTMPGELSNIAAGRIAALYDFKGPNFTTDAACASALAALNAAVHGLEDGTFDAALTGGTDANMSASSFVKFCKIGALSATGSRPYAAGADGFIMGEGAAVFVLKRLADAQEAGDRIYAVIRGIGASSDGKGKGITAPNPAGQRLAVQRAWEHAGLTPQPGDVIEGHGTSTRVGDVAEVSSLIAAFSPFDLPNGSLPLGSVKSNMGHLKGAAGAVGLLKAALALRHRVLPPSINFQAPNPDIDFARSPLGVNTSLRPWDKNGVRRAGVSSFGFGGTNFHVVLEEYDAERSAPSGERRARVAVPLTGTGRSDAVKQPLRGAVVVGGASDADVAERLRRLREDALQGVAPAPRAPARKDLAASVRVAIDFGDAGDLADLSGHALAALESGESGRWRALRNKGVFKGRGAAGKVAFLFTGQGSQYVNMLRELRDVEPIVAETFAEADAVMRPLLGGVSLSERILVAAADEGARALAEEALKQTIITQPAVLTVDTALSRLFLAYGIAPDMVMGHSLGEYAALVAAGALSFADALRAVSARGEAMTHLSLGDNGLMAAVFGPLERVRDVIATIDGYAVIANINSNKECVIGGATTAMGQAMEALRAAGMRVTQLPVSHAFHTDIVAPAAGPLVRVLRSLAVRPPRLPVIANVTGSLYPQGAGSQDQVIELLGRQIGSPVQFVAGLETAYAAGARVFIEMGPKRVLYALVEDVLGDRPDVVALYTNQPRTGDRVSVNRALCGLYALGLGTAEGDTAAAEGTVAVRSQGVAAPVEIKPVVPTVTPARLASGSGADLQLTLGRIFAEAIEKGMALYTGGRPAAGTRVGITGASLGLPGGARIFAEDNVERILRGDPFITSVPGEHRRAMATRGITRLVKGANGEARFEAITDPADVIKLVGKSGALDLASEYGYPEDRIPALDRVTQIAIAAGIDALHDAGIPLVQRYRTTTTGSRLQAGWALPESMRDDTGVILASAWPGLDNYTRILDAYHEHHSREERLAELRSLRANVAEGDGSAVAALERRIAALRDELERMPFRFDRRFLFQVLNMGHAQFAEYIGARGPNIGTNGACASGVQAVTLAKDWIETGRCRRVIVLSADDVTTDALFPWFGSGFLASGVGATDERLEDAALPFDRRRHGLIVGMGGAALVVESLAAAAERAVQPICEIVGSVIANSAYHGSRLDVEHIAGLMEKLMCDVEARRGLGRRALARETVFVSHETYTPARGGSASAEVVALRRVFGQGADAIVVANTKGYTGHAQAVGIEDVLAVKMLETGIVPPVANFREVDPELGVLNLSRGGSYPIRFALRLGAGFGSQIAMALFEWLPPLDGQRRAPRDLGFEHRITDRQRWQRWLAEISGQSAPALEVHRRTLRVSEPHEGPAVVAATVAAPAVASGGEVSRAADAPAAMPRRAPAATPPAADPVRERVLAIVAEQTGYPPDMLALDLDLEADLGIDTVKQAEMFAAIRAEYGIERDENVALRDYPTLARAIEFVYEKRPDLRPPAELPVQAEPPAEVAGRAPSAEPSPIVAKARSAGDREADRGQPRADRVREAVLRIVAKQTGYPPDMLALDLDLEADLGIDTVKQAEMFAAIRAEYGIERDENVALRDYPTLARAIEFVYEKRPDLRAVSTQPAVPHPSEAASSPDGPAPGARPTTSGITGDMEAAQAVPRRVPVARVRPPLERFVPTNVELVGGDRVVIAAGDRAAAALADRLRGRGVVVLQLPVDADPEPQLAAWLAEGEIRGLFWLRALAQADEALLRDPESRRRGIDETVKRLYRTARALYDALAQSNAFLIAATLLGGRHGYDEQALSPANVVGGAVTGFVKALARERPNAVVKTVDFDPEAAPDSIADALLAETLRDPAVVEVGYADGQRWHVALEERRLGETPALPAGGTYVITGAAGSIVSAITADLAAAASGGTFWLLDLTPEPDPNDSDIARLTDDREGLRRDWFDRLQRAGERATPARVEKELARLERARAALAAIESVRRAGGAVYYRSVDLRDAAAVHAVAAEIQASTTRVDVLLHAAGLEISRALPDKEPAEFDRVFDVKVDGWFNLLAGFGDMQLGTAVAFSSIAGRFGNAGQTDYSAANDLLCKATAALPRSHPGARGIAIDWTAWADIGMATRGSIPAIMKQAGIDMLPPAAGIPIVRRELACGTQGEVVIAGALGTMLEERIRGGGLERGEHAPTLIRTATGVDRQRGVIAEIELDPAAQPFLHDHEINGVPVLPGVMGIELMAEAARLAWPERHIVAIENVEFSSPFKFYRGEARVVQVLVQYTQDGADVIGACELFGERTLHGRSEAERTCHFRARVRLAATPPIALPRLEHARQRGAMLEAEAIYGFYFHGPAYHVLGGAWRDNGSVVGSWNAALPPNHSPAEARLLTAPRLLELAFQTAGLLEIADHARMGLPQGIERVVLHLPELAEPAGEGLWARAHESGSAYDVIVCSDAGVPLLSVTGYRTSVLSAVGDTTPFAALLASAVT